MNTRTLFRSSLAAALSMSLLACDGASSVDEDADLIADDIEQENGGFDMEDEAPEFGDPTLFSANGLSDVETDITDVAATDIEAMELDAATDVYDVVVLWGHADFTRDFEGPRDWSGEIEVTRGALRVRRAIRFDAGDRVERDRDDLRKVRFISRTGPHHDGLRLRVVDTDRDSTDRLELIYRTADGEHRIDLARIVERPESREVDARGNRIVATARRRVRDGDPCDTGFMRGRWHQIARNFGVLRGRIADSEGNLTGHMRGLYGTTRAGAQVFFGKAIGLDGRFRGIYAGVYRNNNFVGRWLTRAGEHGVLGGHYRESDAVRGNGGFFMGRWGETSCTPDMARDLP